MRSRSLDALGSRIRIWPAPCTTECLYLGRNQSNDLRQAAEGQSVRLGCGTIALVLEVFYRGLVCLKSSGLFFRLTVQTISFLFPISSPDLEN